MGWDLISQLVRVVMTAGQSPRGRLHCCQPHTRLTNMIALDETALAVRRSLVHLMLAERSCAECSTRGVTLFRKSDGAPVNLDRLLYAYSYSDIARNKGIPLCTACAVPETVTKHVEKAAAEKKTNRDLSRRPSICSDFRIDTLVEKRASLLFQAARARGRNRKTIFDEVASIERQLMALQVEKEDTFDWAAFEKELQKTSGIYTQYWRPSSKWHWTRALNNARREAGAIPGLPFIPQERSRYIQICERNASIASKRGYTDSANAWARVAKAARLEAIKAAHLK